MRSSSINLIMAAVAIFDILTFLFQFKQIISHFIHASSPCLGRFSYWITLIDKSGFVIKDFSRRCSTWLFLSIAFIRTLIVRNPMNLKYKQLSNQPTAFYTIFGVFLLSLPSSAIQIFENNIIEIWQKTECQPQGELTYFIDVAEYFMRENAVLVKVAIIMDALISNVSTKVLVSTSKS